MWIWLAIVLVVVVFIGGMAVICRVMDVAQDDGDGARGPFGGN